mmetsp:Transcript_20781/g.3359  ORF Transcript_20781/g.3359 Transcript_20781/m.3359 type:complete len:87 (-) Transcript_20781:175-435(-)
MYYGCAKKSSLNICFIILLISPRFYLVTPSIEACSIKPFLSAYRIPGIHHLVNKNVPRTQYLVYSSVPGNFCIISSLIVLQIHFRP